MNLMEKIRMIERVDALIRRKATGTPRDLAEKLKVSERLVYNLIVLMKELGAPIYYCDQRCSYCYEYEVEINFGFLQKDKDSIKINGGSNFFMENFLTARFLQ
ncbi:MAG: HTH domain-containing protein [Saprospiraceae bacterium]|nr:HTH domain-containing protein [Saprospiraceae bacterium]